MLEHFADDERTTVVAFYVESFGNPRRFTQVARRVSRTKPILAVKGSRRGEVAHGELCISRAFTDGAATEALFQQAGVRRVESTRRCSTPRICSSATRCRPGAAWVSSRSGGLGTVAADAATARGLRLARLSEQTRSWLAQAVLGAGPAGQSH